MIKEFKIKDILNAVNIISNFEKKNKILNQKGSAANNALDLHNQVKLNKSEVLVLDQMIE